MDFNLFSSTQNFSLLPLLLLIERNFLEVKVEMQKKMIRFNLFRNEAYLSDAVDLCKV
jgi:hypothetical protein